MKIGLFFTNTERDYNKSAASTWIRIWQMIDIYEKLGAEVSFNKPFKPYDVAIVFRKPKRNYYYILKFLKLTSKKVYFDTCINIFERNEEIDPTRLKYALKIGQVADGIICASKQIGSFCEPYSRSVYVMEDPVNTEHFSVIKDNINFDSPIFGWSGVGHKAHFLNRYSTFLHNKSILISEKGIHNAKLNFEYQYIEWKYESFPENILKCDIALLPRQIDTSYNKGHSSFKALVFAVSGVPIIANKVPSYVDLAKFYDGIVFLEDFNDDVQLCVEALKKRELNTLKVRNYYSRINQAKMLLSFFKKELTK